MTPLPKSSRPLVACLLGEADHPELQDAAGLVRATSVCGTNTKLPPEVVLLAQSRPGVNSHREVASLQRRWPLAGFAAILGSWCEGETRTGRLWPGVKRFYWYEFAAWWNEQVARRAAGNCPDWSRPTTDLLRHCPNYKSNGFQPRRSHSVVVVSAPERYTADAVSDVLHRAGFASVWQPPGRAMSGIRGSALGIWHGGQLNDQEASDLASFCRACGREGTPVIAMLDFPRRDRCAVARQLGVAAVLGIPWINAELISTINSLVTGRDQIITAPRRAA
jgi:hypothetical protein